MKGNTMRVAMFTLLAAPLFAQQSAPKIPFESVLSPQANTALTLAAEA